MLCDYHQMITEKKNRQSLEKVSTKVENKGRRTADTVAGAQNSVRTLPFPSQSKSLSLRGEGQQTLSREHIGDIHSALKSKKRENPLPHEEMQENILGLELYLERDRSLEKATNPRPRDSIPAED